MHLKRSKIFALGIFMITLLLASLGILADPVQAGFSKPSLPGVAHSSPGELPKIDADHIFEGEINARGKLVGFHHVGKYTGRITKITRPPNKYGVYEAEFRAFGQTKRFTFFPDKWSRQKVLDSIYEAYLNPVKKSRNARTGKTSDGLRIKMYLDREGNIATAFPLY